MYTHLTNIYKYRISSAAFNESFSFVLAFLLFYGFVITNRWLINQKWKISNDECNHISGEKKAAAKWHWYRLISSIEISSLCSAPLRSDFTILHNSNLVRHKSKRSFQLRIPKFIFLPIFSPLKLMLRHFCLFFHFVFLWPMFFSCCCYFGCPFPCLSIYLKAMSQFENVT